MSTELQTLARDEKRREPANDWRGLPQRLARTPHNRRALRCPSALHRTARAHMAELPPQAMDTADDGAAALRQLLADADLQRLWEACVNVGAKNVEDLRLADRGGFLSVANGFKPLDAYKLQLALGKRQREEAVPPAARPPPPPPSPPLAPVPAPQAIESTPSPVLDAKSRALALSMKEVDDKDVPDAWKSAAYERRKKLCDQKKVAPFALLVRPGEGSALSNGSMDLVVQCRVPGCSAGRNGIKKHGIGRLGGGSRDSCSFSNFESHLDKDGHKQNVRDFLLSLDLPEKASGPAPPSFFRLPKAPPPPQPTSLGAETAPPLHLSTDPRERYLQLMDCDDIKDHFNGDLGNRVMVCKRGCLKGGRHPWSTNFEDARIFSTLTDHIKSDAHQQQGTLLPFVGPVRRRVEIPKLEKWAPGLYSGRALAVTRAVASLASLASFASFPGSLFFFHGGGSDRGSMTRTPVRVSWSMEGHCGLRQLRLRYKTTPQRCRRHEMVA